MADNLAEVFSPVIRIPDIKNASDPSSPSLSEIITFLRGEIFDPNKVRYEIPFSKSLTVEDLKEASKWMGYEVLIIGSVIDNKLTFKLVTGRESDVDDIKASDSIYLRFHNHRINDFPTLADLASGFNNKYDLVGMRDGVVVFGSPSEHPLDIYNLPSLPLAKKSYDILQNINLRRQLMEEMSVGVIADLRISIVNNIFDKDDMLKVNNESNRRFNELFGVSIQRYQFGRDNDKIQEYLDSIQNI